MSVMAGRDGRRVVMGTPQALRRPEALADRDRRMWRMHVEGHSCKEVGREFKLTESIVCRRFKEMPETVKQSIRRDVARIRVMRLQYVHEDLNASA